MNVEDILNKIPTPCYLLEEKLLEKNLKLLEYIQKESGVDILLALKGYSFPASFELVSKYLKGCCASGLYEAKLAKEEFKREVHTYSPAFKEEEIDEIITLSDHLVFNSFSQWKKYRERALGRVSCGIRVNPEFSVAPIELYNPCGVYSRFGVTKKEFREELLDGIEGLHFHALCEESAESLEKVLKVFEEKFGKFIPQMEWVNFGGGHHITKEGYNIEKLISLLKNFREKYNGIKIYLELGEAVGWQTGVLVTRVLDIIRNDIEIAILDTSAETHMPDTLAMPYRPDIRYSGEVGEKKYSYRLGGNSCLSGDIIGDYSFDKPLKIGDKLIIEDQMHYTFVKNTTFNGIKLPSLAILRKNGKLDIIKNFGYEEYRRRL